MKSVLMAEALCQCASGFCAEARQAQLALFDLYTKRAHEDRKAAAEQQAARPLISGNLVKFLNIFGLRLIAAWLFSWSHWQCHLCASQERFTALQEGAVLSSAEPFASGGADQTGLSCWGAWIWSFHMSPRWDFFVLLAPVVSMQNTRTHSLSCGTFFVRKKLLPQPGADVDGQYCPLCRGGAQNVGYAAPTVTCTTVGASASVYFQTDNIQHTGFDVFLKTVFQKNLMFFWKIALWYPAYIAMFILWSLSVFFFFFVAFSKTRKLC